MYFLSVIGMGGLSVVGVSLGYEPPPSALEFSRYMQQIDLYKIGPDHLLNLAIVRIPLEKIWNRP